MGRHAKPVTYRCGHCGEKFPTWTERALHIAKCRRNPANRKR